jgi:hypothetical protein
VRQLTAEVARLRVMREQLEKVEYERDVALRNENEANTPAHRLPEGTILSPAHVYQRSLDDAIVRERAIANRLRERLAEVERTAKNSHRRIVDACHRLREITEAPNDEPKNLEDDVDDVVLTVGERDNLRNMLERVWLWTGWVVTEPDVKEWREEARGLGEGVRAVLDGNRNSGPRVTPHETARTSRHLIPEPVKGCDLSPAGTAAEAMQLVRHVLRQHRDLPGIDKVRDAIEAIYTRRAAKNEGESGGVRGAPDPLIP